MVYAYDVSGQRVLQARVADANGVGSATAYTAAGQFDDANTASTSTGDVTGTRYYNFGGSTVAVRTVAGLSLMLGDEQGSTSVVMPVTVTGTGALASASVADAAAVTRTAYTPYGQLRGADNEAVDRGWLGQVEDRVDGATGTGLTYLNARYYDPVSMRFISPDPLMNPGDPKTFDPYRYADNNPVMFTDASGLEPRVWDDGHVTGVPDVYAVSSGGKVTSSPNKKRSGTTPTPTPAGVTMWDFVPAADAMCGPLPCVNARMHEAYRYPLGRRFDSFAMILLGLSPFGPVLDGIDLVSAASRGDRLGMLLAAVGFLPLGDLAKVRNLRRGESLVPGTGRTVTEAVDAVPRPRGITAAAAEATTAHLNDSGLTVIGRFAKDANGVNYIERAKSEGASYFDVGGADLPPAQQEFANAYFMRIVVAKGDTVLVHGGPDALIGSQWLTAEVQALYYYGYRWNGDYLVPPPS